MYSVLDTWHRDNPGRMVKIGGCLTCRLKSRPYDNAQYNTKYFAHDEVFVIKEDINSTEEALNIESCNIKYAKNVLKIGVNNNMTAALPGATYGKDETGAVYAVPVLPKYKNQESFFDDHVTYCEERKREETDGTFVKNDPSTRKKQDPSKRKKQDPSTRKVSKKYKVRDPSKRKVSKKYKVQDPSKRKRTTDQSAAASRGHPKRGKGTFKCEHFEKTYFSKQALNNHMRNKHP